MNVYAEMWLNVHQLRKRRITEILLIFCRSLSMFFGQLCVLFAIKRIRLFAVVLKTKTELASCRNFGLGSTSYSGCATRGRGAFSRFRLHQVIGVPGCNRKARYWLHSVASRRRGSREYSVFKYQRRQIPVWDGPVSTANSQGLGESARLDLPIRVIARPRKELAGQVRMGVCFQRRGGSGIL